MSIDGQRLRACVAGIWEQRWRHAIFSVFFVLAAGMLKAQTPDISHQINSIQRQIQARVQQDAAAASREAPFRSGAESDASDTSPTMRTEQAERLVCRTVHEISIRGAPQLSQNTREKIAHEFTNKCLGVPEIEAILGLITRDYVDQGYVTTRAHLPTQDLTTGVLEIQVVEGVIEKIQINDGGTNSIEPRTVFPAQAGERLNLRDLEQGIDQLNRLPSNAAHIDIQPGETPGGSVVVVNNTPRFPLRAALSYDNQGLQQTGKDQATLGGSADRLLGLNESISLTHRESVPNDPASKSYAMDSLSLVVPYGYSTFYATRNRSRYATIINTPLGFNPKSSGTNTSENYKLNHVVYRDRATRIYFSNALTFKEEKNYLAGQYLSASSRRLTVLDLGMNLDAALLGGTLALEAGMNKGLRLGGAMTDAPGLPGSAPRAQFDKFRYGASFARPFEVFGKQAGFSTQWFGQTTNQVLYSSEQFLVGGIYSVRGFVNNTLLGDKGNELRNEISLFDTLNIGTALPVRWYAALDAGESRSTIRENRRGGLVGMALGAVASWKGGSYELFYAQPIASPAFFDQERPQLFFRLNLSV